MAKEPGFAAGFLLGGYDFTGDVVGLREIGGGPAALTGCTGIDKSGVERVGGQRDGRLNGTTWFNPSANMGHDRLGNLPTTDVHAQYWHRQTIARPVACIVAKQVNYDGTRAQDGSFTFEWDLLANGYGIEWATGLTSYKRTDTGATNGTGVDMASATWAASAAFGAQFYLQVPAFTGTSATITVQESSDNGAGDAFTAVTGGTFTTVTGITTERIQTARGQTVERYLRVVTTGTFSNLVFAVAAVRNDATVSF